ncbi:MAG TPA: hypothetical protein VIH66_01015 [Gammaproteobacteria bacterium]
MFQAWLMIQVLKQHRGLVMQHGGPTGRIRMQDQLMILEIGHLTVLVQWGREKITDEARQALQFYAMVNDLMKIA